MKARKNMICALATYLRCLFLNLHLQMAHCAMYIVSGYQVHEEYHFEKGRESNWRVSEMKMCK